MLSNNIYSYKNNKYLSKLETFKLKPNELLTQLLIRELSIKELNEHGIKLSLSKCKKKIILDYHQILAKDDDPISKECRGLILARDDSSEFPTLQDGSIDESFADKTKIVAFGMMRFFNYGKGAATINWNDPRLSIQDKLDGSMCNVYYDITSDRWHVATRFVSEADVGNGGYTFRQLFEKAVKDTLNMSFDMFTASLVRNMTYTFELTTPYNKVVVNYDDCRIALLAVRYIPTLREEDPSELAIVQTGVPVCKTYSTMNEKELVDFVNSLNGMNYEGVVVRDSSFNRVKIKNPGYLLNSRMKEKLSNSNRNILEVVLSGMEDDLMPIMSKSAINSLVIIKQKVATLIESYDLMYNQFMEKYNLLETKTKKDFAIMFSKDPSIWKTPLFHMYDGKVSSMSEFLLGNKECSNSFLDSILDIIGVSKEFNIED